MCAQRTWIIFDPTAPIIPACAYDDVLRVWRHRAVQVPVVVDIETFWHDCAGARGGGTCWYGGEGVWGATDCGGSEIPMSK